MTGGKFPPDADRPPMALLYTVIGLVVILAIYETLQQFFQIW